MHVLITGGTGFIGRALTSHLVAEGNLVTVLSRSQHPGGFPAGVRTALWDGKTAQGWGKLVDEVDVVVNLAAENIGIRRWTKKRREELLTSRQNSASAVIDALNGAAPRPRMVIQPSGTGYYGTDPEEVFKEDDKAGSDYMAGLAVLWEQAIAPAASELTRLVITRMGVILSRQDGVLPRLEIPIRLFIGGPLGNGRQWYPWIHMADVIGAMTFLMCQPDSEGIYNLVAPRPVRQAEMSRQIAKKFGRPYWAPAPAFLLKLALGELSMLVLKGQRVQPVRLQQAGYQFRFPDLSSALSDLYPAKR